SFLPAHVVGQIGRPPVALWPPAQPTPVVVRQLLLWLVLLLPSAVPLPPPLAQLRPSCALLQLLLLPPASDLLLLQPAAWLPIPHRHAPWLPVLRRLSARQRPWPELHPPPAA